MNNNKNMTAYIIAVVVMIVGAVFLFRGFKEKALVDEGFENYNELSYKDVKDGMLVEGEFYYGYGTFAEEYETTYGIRLSDNSEVLYYVVEAGNDEEMETLEYRYVGFKATPSWFDKMDELTDETDEYFLDEDAPEPTPVRFTAKVSDMSDELYGYMEEAFIDTGVDASEMDYYIHPVILTPYNEEGYKSYTIVGIVGVALGAVILVGALMVNSKKKKQEDVYY